jgi:rifampicin phosphotransferase
MSLIRALEEVSRADAGLVGAKAAALGDLNRLSCPVPPGFCLTTDAYRAHMRAWRLEAELRPFLERTDWNRAADRAAAVFAERMLAPSTIDELVSAYDRRRFARVAVRSSATLEDLPDASFAGQQDTILDVRGANALVEAVRRCWASYWSARAIAYRQQHGIEQTSGAMAVLVQEMVDADRAGVLFSIDPVTRRSDRIVIQVGRGVGEAVVSGRVTGDVYRVDRGRGLRVVERDLSGATPLLSDQLIVRLCETALRVEQHFGAPQDIEFAVARSEIAVLQARPVTMPAVEPEPIPPTRRPTRIEALISAEADERYPIAPRPLDQIFFGVQIEASVHMLQLMGFSISRDEEARVQHLMWRERYLVPRLTPGWRLILAPRLPLWALARDWETWWRDGHRARIVDVTAPIDLRALGDAALVARIDAIVDLWRLAMKERFPALFGRAGDAVLTMVVMLLMGPKRAATLVADLKAGIRTATIDANDALCHLVRRIQADKPVADAVRAGDFARAEREPAGAALKMALERFLAAFGHREGVTWYLSTPVWRRDPTQVWHLLQALATLPAAPADDGEARYERARHEIETRARLVPGLTKLFAALLQRVRALERFRENSHFDLLRPLAALQDVVAECARRLQDRERIAQPSDAFYLTRDELAAWMTGSAPPKDAAWQLIRRRRITYEIVNARWEARKMSAAKAGATVLKGQGASPGAVKARARIVRDVHEFDRMRPGDILVCPYTNPGWTPLFVGAAGVVTETGGPGAHAAIVAREYGIPAVMGVAGATTRIEDGAEIVIDGTAGRVWLAAKTPPNGS